jgi:hypothetical protein
MKVYEEADGGEWKSFPNFRTLRSSFAFSRSMGLVVRRRIHSSSVDSNPAAPRHAD